MITNIVASWSKYQVGCLALSLGIVYIASIAIYRLWLSPIAHVPGPKLAALTRHYECYYDLVLDGQYVFKIDQMHKKYGAVVRIGPWEVHIAEPDFYYELLTGDTRPRDKSNLQTRQVLHLTPKLAFIVCINNHHLWGPDSG